MSICIQCGYGSRAQHFKGSRSLRGQIIQEIEVHTDYDIKVASSSSYHKLPETHEEYSQPRLERCKPELIGFDFDNQ